MQYKIWLGLAGQSAHTVHSKRPVETSTSAQSSDCNDNSLIHSIQEERNQRLNHHTTVAVGHHWSRTATVVISWRASVPGHRENPLSVKAE